MGAPATETAVDLRPQCQPCPWRDVAWMQANAPDVLAAARQGVNGFVCHTRCGPCDGPTHAGVLGVPE